jgi:hypothetical protein
LILDASRPVATPDHGGAIRPSGRLRFGRVRWSGDLRVRERPWGLGHRLLTLAVVAYAGGLVMFTTHAIIRQEKGPPISNVDHWLLDSSLGFVALAPVVIVGVALLARYVAPSSWRFPIVAGLLFAFVTIPGPIAHDKAVGEDSVGATLATHFCGIDRAALLRPGIEHSPQSECLVQLLVGIPTYVALFSLMWWLGRSRHEKRYPSAWSPTSDSFLVVPRG